MGTPRQLNRSDMRSGRGIVRRACRRDSVLLGCASLSGERPDDLIFVAYTGQRRHPSVEGMARCTGNLMMVLREVEAGATARPDRFQGTSFTFANVPESENPAIDREFGRPAVLVNEHLVAAALINQSSCPAGAYPCTGA